MFFDRNFYSSNAAMIEGEKIGLTQDQMKTLEFGMHTVNAIKREVAQGVSLNTAYARYRGLHALQVKGLELGLTKYRVLLGGLSDHVLVAMEKDIEKGMYAVDAYNLYTGLSFTQIEGVRLGLSRKQVRASNFNYKTVSAIRMAMENNVSCDVAYERYRGLTEEEIKKKGIEKPKRKRVFFSVGELLNKMSAHEIGAIQRSLDADEKLPIEMRGLSFWQMKGMEVFELTIKQVKTPKFDYYAFMVMKGLREKGRTIREAYSSFFSSREERETIDARLADQGHADTEKGLAVFRKTCRKFSGLSIFQIQGVELGLTSREVRASNFSRITIEEIKESVKLGCSIHQAYERYSGFNEDEIQAIKKLNISKKELYETGFRSPIKLLEARGQRGEGRDRLGLG